MRAPRKPFENEGDRTIDVPATSAADPPDTKTRRPECRSEWVSSLCEPYFTNAYDEYRVDVLAHGPNNTYHKKGTVFLHDDGTLCD